MGKVLSEKVFEVPKILFCLYFPGMKSGPWPGHGQFWCVPP